MNKVLQSWKENSISVKIFIIAFIIVIVPVAVGLVYAIGWLLYQPIKYWKLFGILLDIWVIAAIVAFIISIVKGWIDLE